MKKRIVDLKLIQQRCDYTCTSACIAMLTGIDIAEIEYDFHSFFMDGITSPIDFLTKRGFEFELGNSYESFKYGYVHLVTVPSLNKVGILHNIVVDFRDIIMVFDPNDGRPGKRYYIYGEESESSLQEEMKGYIVDLKIRGENFA